MSGFQPPDCPLPRLFRVAPCAQVPLDSLAKSHHTQLALGGYLTAIGRKPGA